MQLMTATAADLASVPDPAVPRILFFGTIRPYKGVDLLIDACLQQWQAGQEPENGARGLDHDGLPV